MGMQGTTTVNFGSAGTDVTIQVSEPTIQANNLVEAWVFPVATATNTVDDQLSEHLNVRAHSVVAGVGFSITVICTQEVAHGQYTIGYVFN